MVAPRRFEVFLVPLDPTRGAEMQKTRPCVIVSPDEANDVLHTVVVIPLSSTVHGFPGRVRVRSQERDGELATDQIRVVDKRRLLRRLGTLPSETRPKLVKALLEFFR
ncbi:MAG TPA: type II toxin-antitoxin system PemK/MazF family toxin [Rhizomicrobium sp.]